MLNQSTSPLNPGLLDFVRTNCEVCKYGWGDLKYCNKYNKFIFDMGDKNGYSNAGPNEEGSCMESD
jgi:hypothetical protein